MKAALSWGSRAVEGLLVGGLALMSLLVFANVLLRYVFNSGIAPSDEAARFLFVWLTFLGAVAATWRGEHIRAEFLRARLGAVGQRWLDIVGELVVVLCCCVLIDGAWRLTVLNLDNRAPISGVPMAVVYSAGLFSGVAILGLSLHRLWRLVAQPASAAALQPGTARGE